MDFTPNNPWGGDRRGAYGHRAGEGSVRGGAPPLGEVARRWVIWGAGGRAGAGSRRRQILGLLSPDLGCRRAAWASTGERGGEPPRAARGGSGGGLGVRLPAGGGGGFGGLERLGDVWMAIGFG